jgi:hypothetical protein
MFRITPGNSLVVTTDVQSSRLPVIVTTDKEVLISEALGGERVHVCIGPDQGFFEVSQITIVNTLSSQVKVNILLQIHEVYETIYSSLLSIGDSLSYTQSGGWSTNNSSGSAKYSA